MQIAVVEHPSDSAPLADLVRGGLAALEQKIDVLHMPPTSCMHAPLPRQVGLVFVRIVSMQEVETARQIAYFREDVPLVIVSNSPEYGLEGFRLRAVDYLLEPLREEDIMAVLHRCLPQKEGYDDSGGD